MAKKKTGACLQLLEEIDDLVSLRGVKRRSNLNLNRERPRLLRFARNDVVQCENNIVSTF